MVGSALDGHLECPRAFRGAVAALCGFRRLAVELHEQRIVHVGAERFFDSIKVGAMPVRRELDAIGYPILQVADQGASILGIPAADQVGDDELGIRLDRGPGPDVASPFRLLLRRRDVRLLGVGEGLNFIDLDALGLHAARMLVMIGRAYLPGVLQHLRDCVDRHVHHAADGPHGRALAEHREDLDTLCEGQTVQAPSI